MNELKGNLICVLYSILWTVFIAAATILMAFMSGIDPRNDLFGHGLATIGLLTIPIYGWPAGILKIWMGD